MTRASASRGSISPRLWSPACTSRSRGSRRPTPFSAGRSRSPGARFRSRAGSTWSRSPSTGWRSPGTSTTPAPGRPGAWRSTPARGRRRSASCPTRGEAGREDGIAVRTAALAEAQPSLRPVTELRWERDGLHLRLTAQGAVGARGAAGAGAFGVGSRAHWAGGCIATRSWGWPGGALLALSVFLPWYGTDPDNRFAQIDGVRGDQSLLGGAPDPALAAAGRLGGAVHPRLHHRHRRQALVGARRDDDGDLDRGARPDLLQRRHRPPRRARRPPSR